MLPRVGERIRPVSGSAPASASGGRDRRVGASGTAAADGIRLRCAPSESAGICRLLSAGWNCPLSATPAGMPVGVSSSRLNCRRSPAPYGIPLGDAHRSRWDAGLSWSRSSSAAWQANRAARRRPRRGQAGMQCRRSAGRRDRSSTGRPECEPERCRLDVVAIAISSSSKGSRSADRPCRAIPARRPGPRRVRMRSVHHQPAASCENVLPPQMLAQISQEPGWLAGRIRFGECPRSSSIRHICRMPDATRNDGHRHRLGFGRCRPPAGGPPSRSRRGIATDQHPSTR